MNCRKFVAHLEGCGCYFVREGRRHSLYRNMTNGRKTSVPRHSEIAPGLVKKICKDLNISPPGEK